MYQVLRFEQTEIYTTGDSTTHVRAFLVCDTVSDLPGINDISGYTLEMGSNALVIQNAAQYKMKSDGTWVLQQSADLQTIITTLSQIQSDISDIDSDIIDINADILTLQQKLQKIEPALKSIINDGPKNTADMTSTTFTTVSKDGVTVTLSGDVITTSGNSGTTTNSFYNVYYTPNTVMIPPGTWCASLHGSGIENFRLEIYDNITGDVTRGNFGDPFTFTIPDGVSVSYLRITQKPSSACDGSFRLMICRPEYYEMTTQYEPYAPTNKQLLDLIHSYHP